MGTIPEMTPDPPDVRKDVLELVELLDYRLQPLTALLELLRRPQNVTEVPSDEWVPTTYTLGVAGGWVTVAQDDLTRLRVTLINSGGSTVWLHRDTNQALPTQPGAALLSGAALTLATTAEISAMSTAGDGELSVIIEFRNAGGTSA